MADPKTQADPQTPPVTVTNAWPTEPVNGPPDPELWKTIKDDERARYEKLKLYRLPGHSDITLFDCYDRAYRLSQYFASVHAALRILKRRIPQEETQIWKVMDAFSEAIDTGLRAFWQAMNDDALQLLEHGKYAPIHIALALPGKHGDAGKRPLDDPEDGVPKPANPDDSVEEGDDFLQIFIGFVNVLCNHYPKLKEVGPKTGVSWSQVLGSVVQAGQAFYDEYTHKKGDPPRSRPSLPGVPGSEVVTRPGGKKKNHGGNGGPPGGVSKL